MVRSKLGLKILGLCVLALGLMAMVGSSAAQAEVGAKWTYINPVTKVLSEFTKALEGQLLLEFENKTASLLFTTGGGTKVTILCTTGAFDEGGQLSAEGEILLGRILFKGCVTLLNGALSGACKPNSAGTVAKSGEILTLKGKGLIRLHELTATKEKDSTVVLKPDDEIKEEFVNIQMGEECAIGESVPVTGLLVAWDCKGNTSFKTHAKVHLLEEFPGLKLLKALGQPATISGSINVSLGGEHNGWEWAGLPN